MYNRVWVRLCYTYYTPHLSLLFSPPLFPFLPTSIFPPLYLSRFCLYFPSSLSLSLSSLPHCLSLSTNLYLPSSFSSYLPISPLLPTSIASFSPPFLHSFLYLTTFLPISLPSFSPLPPHSPISLFPFYPPLFSNQFCSKLNHSSIVRSNIGSNLLKEFLFRWPL